MLNKRLLALAIFGCFSASAAAGTFTATTSGNPGQTVPLQVTFTGDGETVNADLRLDFDNTNITLSNAVGATASDVCQVVSATRIRIVPPDGGATPLPGAATLSCTFDVAIGAGAPTGTTIPFTVATIGCTNADGDASAAGCTLAAGAGVTVNAPAAERALSFNPNFDTTITFPAGTTVGTAATPIPIAVSATGNTGTASVTGCATTGTGFSVTPTDLTFNDADSSTRNLNVGCTYGAADQTGTLSCTHTDQGVAAATRTWNLSCPAPNATPTITSPTATTFSVSGGSPGTLGTGAIAFAATGGGGNGSATINCSSTGNVVVALGGATPAGTSADQTVTGSAQPQQVRVGVTLTGAAQSPAGTVVCNITDSAGASTSTFTINAPAGTTFVPPNVIPASSLWSQLSLIALFAALGGLVLVLRRNG